MRIALPLWTFISTPQFSGDFLHAKHIGFAIAFQQSAMTGIKGRFASTLLNILLNTLQQAQRIR